MPSCEVRVFRDREGNCPLQEWIDNLEVREPVAYARCLDAILQLSRRGFELRRPQADYLRDGIYELRVKIHKVHFRILYFFCGQSIVALSHGLKKNKSEVPPDQIDKAIEHMILVKRNMDQYTALFEL